MSSGFRILMIFGCATIGLVGCAAPAPPPVVVRAKLSRPLAAAPDWFHRDLALARRAEKSHLARGDTAGAQSAFWAVMLPACQRAEKSGPAKYQTRCAAMVAHTATAATQAVDEPSCSDGHDDSADTPEQKTACSD